MGRLRERFAFGADTEIAAEIDPRCLEPEMAQALGQAGVNRASIGVQDFDPGVQKAINREQSFADTAAAVARLRGAGVERLNVDMVYGLPGQTVSGILSTVDQVIELKPQRLALFGYAHVPWHQPRQMLIPEWMLPGAAERLELFAAAALSLESHGFLRIALDHFARPDDPLARAAEEGRLRRTFQGYTDIGAESVLGLGASAISTLPAGMAQNAVPPKDYGAAIQGGGLATARGIARTGDDDARGAVIERLMCDFRADLPRIAARFGLAPDHFDGAAGKLAPLIAEGLVSMREGELSLAAAGRPLVRTVCAAFDRYWTADQGPARHARAL
jgi:oxygen-independent coproporphyrinogen-3 oxidase